ncbi:MAG: hypothetical protein GXO71_06735, partial [Caldiserica bacterium]|nr:hypothetical protein [Caldisericota bacterium]
MRALIKKRLAIVLGIIWQYLIIPIPIVWISFYVEKKLPFGMPEMMANLFFFAVFFSLGIFWTVRSFFDLTVKGEGTIIPHYSPKKLVHSGVYNYCRNPLYLGYILLFAGFSFLFHSLTLLIFSVSCVLTFLRLYTVPVEEKALLRRFGETYLQYRKETPFLLPLKMKKSWDKATKIAHVIFLITVLYLAALEIYTVFWGMDTLKNNDFSELPLVSPIQKGENILILAPHPDDETLACAGIIQKALEAGASIKIVYLTSGESNFLSFASYKKKIALAPSAYTTMGKMRMREAMLAMQQLGIKKEDLIFLGYPDRGTLSIWQAFWQKPYTSIFNRVSYVPYPGAYHYKSPYTGESILKSLKEIIVNFKPTRIFVSHPADKNSDHQALYCFLRVALLDLKGKIPQPLVYPYLTHYGLWPAPFHYHPEYPLLPPLSLQEVVEWKSSPLQEKEIQEKLLALSFYKSQMSARGAWLISFVRKNELFGDFPHNNFSKLEENPHFKSRFPRRSKSKNQIAAGNNIHIGEICYSIKGENLKIDISFSKRIEEWRELSLFLYGYREDTPFPNMPKILLKTN